MITHKLFVSQLSNENKEEIKKALHEVSGLQGIQMDVKQNEVMITYIKNIGSLPSFECAIIDLGYEVKHLGCEQ